MDGSSSSEEQLVPFRNAGRLLADLDPTTTGHIIASAADVALVVEEGVIRDVALGNQELSNEGYDRAWRNQAWVETVTLESRPKIEALLQSDSGPSGRWRQVNHPSLGGTDVPIRYTAIRTPRRDRIVAIGRDLRAISKLQQRLVEAHQNLERDFARLREASARYTLLFRSVSQPLLIVNPVSLAIEDVNPAVETALGAAGASLVGSAFGQLFTAESQPRAAQAVAESLAMGRCEAPDLELRSGGHCHLGTSAYRDDDDAKVIARLEVHGTDGAGAGHRPNVLDVLEALPDGLVVAGPDLRILAANRAFLEMAQCVGPGQLAGVALSEHLGRSNTEFNVLVSNLKNHGVVRSFATVLRDRFGSEEEVEVSAVTAPHQDALTFGFSVRSVSRALRTRAPIRDALPNTPAQLSGLVGRVPLQEIVRESTDFIEKLCIEIALEITDDNRASAAEMLGLSRQGLYSKLRRFGIDESR